MQLVDEGANVNEAAKSGRRVQLVPIGRKGATRPDRDEGCNSSTREQTSTRLQTRRRRVQNRDEGCNSSRFPIPDRDEGANIDKAAKSGRTVQLVPIPDRDEGRGTNDQNCNFSSCTILGHHKEQKNFFFFFSQSVDRKCQSDHSAESLTGLSKRPS